MKKIILFKTIIVMLLFCYIEFYIDRANAKSSPKKQIKIQQITSSSRLSNSAGDSSLKDAMSLAKDKDYPRAAKRFYQLSRDPRSQDQRSKIKYLLGMMFYEMKLYQTAAFQFVDVVRSGTAKQVQQALEKLAISADYLNDDVMLKYAISKVSITNFPKSLQDMLSYRLGEFRAQRKEYPQAVSNLASVEPSSKFFSRAKYEQALALAESNILDQSEAAFDELLMYRKNKRITDNIRVSALIGKARVLYQKKKWVESLNVYRTVPRDTELFHQAMFESSWSLLRAGRFREALNNFHSIHSDYYEDFYIPESLILRSIVYMFICQYDETEKVINLFEKIYNPVKKQVNAFLSMNSNKDNYYNEIEKMYTNYNDLIDNIKNRKNYKLPFMVARNIIKRGDFKRAHYYLDKLKNELNTIEKQDDDWKNAPVGRYAKQILARRIIAAKQNLGIITRRHLLDIKDNLRDLFEQDNLIRFEMVNGQKEVVKQQVAMGEKKQNQNQDQKRQIAQNEDRDFYVKNGYEYYPFRGEIWLDEIGNAHYLGVQSCDNKAKN